MRKISKKIVSTALVSVLALSGIPYSMTPHAEEVGTQTDAEAVVSQDETEKENLEEVQVGTLAVNEANFPDANFRSYLLEEFDSDGDGMINPEEVYSIYVAGDYLDENTPKISTLKGIEYFPNLETLRCENNNLTSLDVSQNPALDVLFCSYNNLTSLDVSQNPVLERFSCDGNNLTNLDVSQNPALETLFCDYNNLTSLDVSQNSALKELWCSDNNLTSLDVSQNPALYRLECSNNNLTSLDVSQNPALDDLFCDNNNLTSLDVSQNPKLLSFGCRSNNLTSLDVSHNPVLYSLFCENNNLTSLDLSHNPTLCELECSNNNLTSLDLRQNTELGYLWCYHNNLTSLDLSNNTELRRLSYDYDKVRGVNLSNLTSLNNLVLYFQELPQSGTLDLSNIGYHMEGLDMGAIKYQLVWISYTEDYYWSFYNNDTESNLGISVKTLQDESSSTDIPTTPTTPNVTGIYHLLQNRDGIVAGLCTEGLDKSQYEFSWYVCKDGKNWIMAQDWTAGNEWLSYKPDENGEYVLVGKARPIGGSDADILSTASYFSYHHEICGRCQMPYDGEGGGYLIGFESYENPNQSYQYEMLVLDCTKLANGEDAWIYTTGKCGAGDGKALWTVWQPQYGYYWTLFRLYDADGNMLDEVCYGFQNI